MKIINYYHNKTQDVIVKYLDENNNKQYKKIQYDGYFWVLTKDFDKADEVLKDLVVEDYFSKNTSQITFTKGREEGEWTQIYYSPINEVYLKSIVKGITHILNVNNIKHFEADLWPGDLFMLDNPDLEIADMYNILYWDIETDDRTGGIVLGRDRILSICAIDDKGNEFRFCDDDEKVILEQFVELVGNYDIIMSWNGNKFDTPYVKSRLLKNDIYFSFKSIINIDLMKVFMSSFAVSHTFGKKYIESFALDFIAREYLQDQKLELEDSGGYGGRIYKMFQEDREKLLKYNMQDCVLLKKLNEKYNLFQNEIEVSKYVGFPLSKTRSASAIVDVLLLRECRKRKIHWKTAWDVVGDKPHQDGGIVLEPVPGLHENINIYDFSSMYPSIFITANISPDTVLDEHEDDCIVLPNNTCFTNKFTGIIPEVLDKLTTLRLKYKATKIRLNKEGKPDESKLWDFKETALKVIILSVYGISGAIFSRFFDLRIANGITQTGQYLLTNIAKELNFNGFKVVAGDTDSIFYLLDSEDNRGKAEKVIKDTIQNIVNSMNTHRKATLVMEHEKIGKRGIFLSKNDVEGVKKKYAMRCIWDGGKVCDYLYYRGMELHVSSQTKIAKQFLEEILMYILWCENKPEIKELERIIMKYKKRILNKEVEASEITIVKRIGKLPSEYKNLPQHIKLAEDNSKKGDYFFVGAKIPHIVIQNKPLKIINKRDFSGIFDTKYYWENQLWGPVFRVVNTVFPKYRWEKWEEGSKEMQQTL